jgi:transposase
MCSCFQMHRGIVSRLFSLTEQGLWVCAKRIEKGRVHWLAVDHEQRKVLLSHEELTMLLGGIDLAKTRERKWYRKPLAEESSQLQTTA